VINNRERYCDWEGDLIVGKSNKGAVATMVERKSGFLLTGLMYGKTSNEFMITIRDMFAPFDNDFLKSITYDNGSESAGFISIEEFLHCDFYFAYPAAPWQRGTNENTNGLLRRYFPKKTKFRNVCPKLLDEITELINCRPRKRLSYRTPLEVLLKQGLRL
jgi:IS30 family transposase